MSLESPTILFRNKLRARDYTPEDVSSFSLLLKNPNNTVFPYDRNNVKSLLSRDVTTDDLKEKDEFDQAYSLSKLFEKNLQQSKRLWVIRSREKRRLKQQSPKRPINEEFGMTLTRNNLYQKIVHGHPKKQYDNDMLVSYYRKKYKNFNVSGKKPLRKMILVARLENEGPRIEPW